MASHSGSFQTQKSDFRLPGPLNKKGLPSSTEDKSEGWPGPDVSSHKDLFGQLAFNEWSRVRKGGLYLKLPASCLWVGGGRRGGAGPGEVMREVFLEAGIMMVTVGVQTPAVS